VVKKKKEKEKQRCGEDRGDLEERGERIDEI